MFKDFKKVLYMYCSLTVSLQGMYFRSSNPIRFHSQKTRGQLLSCLDINVALLDTEHSQRQVDSSTPCLSGEVELCKAQLDKVKKAQKAGPTDPGFHLSSTETSHRSRGWPEEKLPNYIVCSYATINFQGILYPAWPFNGKLISV